MMTLRDLCRPFPELSAQVAGDVAVTGVVVDSRAVRPGALFVAVRGSGVDGHRFLPDAVAAGCAAAVVAEEATLPDGVPDDLPLLRVADTRPWGARLARELAGRPDAGMTAVGVTGTNGKTTTAFLLRHLLAATAGPCGLVGTIRYETGRRIVPAPLTTPSGPDLFGLLGEMRDAGCRGVALEVSSHALDQGRVADLALDAAVLTNLSRDHLDYHGDMDRYRRAKLGIVELLAGPRRDKGDGVLVVNADDPAFAGIAPEGIATVRYGTADAAGPVDLRLLEAGLSPTGSNLVLEWRGRRLTLASRLVGRFNVSNLLAAAATGLALGFPPEQVTGTLASAPQVPGRMESLQLPGGAVAVVDYAHTPAALEAVLVSCRELTAGRLHVVFGCGGDRDRGKRPQMGAVAARLADVTWITSDNPRHERPEDICDQIAAGYRGVSRVDGRDCRIVVDRTRAIREALAGAAAGDTVVIAGKGHEDYQIVGDVRRHLDDREIVRAWIEEVDRG